MRLRRTWMMTLLVAITTVVAITGLACGGGATADQSGPNNHGIQLKDGPPGQPGSRFDNPDVEVNLTAQVFEWEVYEGQTAEVWGFNGQYPGPEIRATEGDKVRINVTNELPEATTIHWHGLEVPNDQDGVPGITQPAIQPGETWTYEFVAPHAGTTMYHTHTNTVKQLSRGMFGPFIVEPEEGLDEYDREYTLMLHEIEGLYTINGHAFPKTMEDTLLGIKTGEKVLVRLVNAGQQHHPMHLHGHQFKVVQFDGSPLESPLMINTQDIAPGQTVDVEITGNNPGTWVFHCHIIPHVTNRGDYPGGMIVVLDYEDHTSYFESNPPLPETTDEADSSNGQDEGDHGDDHADSSENASEVDSEVTVNTFDLGYSVEEIVVNAGERTLITLQNDGALEHDLVVEGTDFHLHVPSAGSSDSGVLQIDEPGTYVFYCSIPGHRGAGMEGVIRVQ